MGNTIGKGNRFMFLAFLMIETVAMSSGLAVAILRVHQSMRADDYLDGMPWIALFILGDGFLLIGVTALMATQVHHCRDYLRFTASHIEQIFGTLQLEMAIGMLLLLR